MRPDDEQSKQYGLMCRVDRYSKVVRAATMNADKIIFVGLVIDHFDWVTVDLALYSYIFQCIW